MRTTTDDQSELQVTANMIGVVQANPKISEPASQEGVVRKKIILVTGAGGFIGHHLVKRLVAEGHFVRGADVKLPEFETSTAHEFLQIDLRDYDKCMTATRG